MAGEFDFEPLSEEQIAYGLRIHDPHDPEYQACAEALAWRAAGRALVEAEGRYGRATDLYALIDEHEISAATHALDKAQQKLRALVAHVGGGGK